MKLPSLDTKRIRRLDSGAFTVEAESQIGQDNSLCSYCGRGRCQVRDQFVNAQPKWCVPSVRRCERFLPVLGFSVLEGLDHSFWNTIRLGKAWAARLKPGQEVAIADTRAKRILRRMRVASAHEVTLHQAVTTHFQRHHAIQSLGLSDPVQSQGRLMQILRNAYGSNFAAPSRPASVVYLEAKREHKAKTGEAEDGA